ncbi:hypothetical protein VPH35_080305 [Triticum aestivum]
MANSSPSSVNKHISETSSRCRTECVTTAHNFEVTEYSLLEGMGIGKFVSSSTFSVGGYNWNIRIYPDGRKEEDKAAYMSAFLSTCSNPTTGVQMKNTFSLLEKDGKVTCLYSDTLMVWVGMGATRRRGRGGVGNDDCITIRCVLTVMKEPRTEDVSTVMVQVPQSDLQTHFTNMLNHGEGMDINLTIHCRSRTLRAHRCVLAARSLVFKAELFGQMKETTKRRVKINDMEPAIFEALLPFIYTDSWPSNCDLDQNAELQHLLVAADRYGLERLKIICEGKLCQKIDVQTVATTLALAEQHDATQLKNACLRYLSSQEVLRAVKETDGFKHLTASCPWIMMDILERVAPPSGV